MLRWSNRRDCTPVGTKNWNCKLDNPVWLEPEREGPFFVSTMNRVTAAQIAELLQPFQLTLNWDHLEQISFYIDLLLRWTSRVNLTAVRDPEEIVTRHFGESLFAASRLYPQVGSNLSTRPPESGMVGDVGAGLSTRRDHLIDI